MRVSPTCPGRALRWALALLLLAPLVPVAEEPMPKPDPFESVRGWRGVEPGMSPDEVRAALKAAGLEFRERFHGKDGSLWFTLELPEDQGTIYFETETQKVNQILLQSKPLAAQADADARVEAKRKAWGEPRETRTTKSADTPRKDTFHTWRNAHVTAELDVAHDPASEERWIVWEKYVAAEKEER